MDGWLYVKLKFELPFHIVTTWKGFSWFVNIPTYSSRVFVLTILCQALRPFDSDCIAVEQVRSFCLNSSFKSTCVCLKDLSLKVTPHMESHHPLRTENLGIDLDTALTSRNFSPRKYAPTSKFDVDSLHQSPNMLYFRIDCLHVARSLSLFQSKLLCLLVHAPQFTMLWVAPISTSVHQCISHHLVRFDVHKHQHIVMCLGSFGVLDYSPAWPQNAFTNYTTPLHCHCDDPLLNFDTLELEKSLLIWILLRSIPNLSS